MQLAAEMFQGIKHLLFPALCAGCGKALVRGEETICLNCETFLAKTHYHHIANNETALRLSGRIPFKHATSLAYFTTESLLQHLIHGLKYKGKKRNGFFLGKEIGRVLKTEGWETDAIVPVPLHPKKQAKRGYNQSVCISEGLGEILKLPVITKALIRKRFTESQTEKTREERISNVADAFAVRHPELIEGRHILLVDDVLTTGATLEACAQALLRVPDISISVATAGIAH